MNAFPVQEIEKKIGYAFQNTEFLRTAFTHSTYAHANGGKDNERMEYLGDSVLQLVVTEWQVTTSKKSEGELTKLRQKLVCEDALYDAVQDLKVSKYLLISGGKENIGKKTVSSLYETIVCAIYFDGGYEKAKDFICRTLLQTKPQAEKNPKGELQEWLQSRGKTLPVYESVKEGKDNAPTFHCTVTADGKRGKGTGNSKRQAEQLAAENLLSKLT